VAKPADIAQLTVDITERIVVGKPPAGNGANVLRPHQYSGLLERVRAMSCSVCGWGLRSN